MLRRSQSLLDQVEEGRMVGLLVMGDGDIPVDLKEKINIPLIRISSREVEEGIFSVVQGATLTEEVR